MPIEPYITARHSTFLCSENIGLGNVLFQIASIYGISKKHDLTYCYNTVVDYCNIIKSKFGIDISKSLLRNVCIPSVVETDIENVDSKCGPREYETQLIKMFINNPTKHYILYAYLENVDYFNEYYDEIKALFSPTEMCLQAVKDSIPRLYDTTITPVSIHFRYLWNTLDDDYYKKAVAYIKEHVTNPHFFLFCDTASASNIKMIGLKDGEFTKVKLSPEQIDIELYAIGQCSHHIVSQSTFCFWGVYLNKNPSKIIVKSNVLNTQWYGETCVSI